MDDTSTQTPVHIVTLLPYFKVTGQNSIPHDVARGILSDAIGDNAQKDILLQELCSLNYVVYEEDTREYYLTSVGSSLLSTILANEAWDPYLLYWAQQLQLLHQQLCKSHVIDGMHLYAAHEIHYNTLFQHIISRPIISRDVVHACVGHTSLLATHLLPPELALQLLSALHRHCSQPLPSVDSFASPRRSEVNDICHIKSAIDLTNLHLQLRQENHSILSILAPLLPRIFYLPPSLETSMLQVQFMATLALVLAERSRAASSDAVATITNLMHLSISLTHQLFDAIPRTSLPSAAIEYLYQETLLQLAQALIVTDNVNNVLFNLPQYAILHISKTSRYHPNIAYALLVEAKLCVYHNQYADAIECLSQALLNYAILPKFAPLAEINVADFSAATAVLGQLPPSLTLVQLGDLFELYGIALHGQNLDYEHMNRLSYVAYRRVLDENHPICRSLAERITPVTTPTLDIDDQPYDTTKTQTSMDDAHITTPGTSTASPPANDDFAATTNQIHAILLLKHGLYKKGLRLLEPTCLWSSLLCADILSHLSDDCDNLYTKCSTTIANDYSEECYVYCYILYKCGLGRASSDIAEAIELIEEAQVISELICKNSSNLFQMQLQIQLELALCKLHYCNEDTAALSAAENVYSKVCMSASDSTIVASILLDLGSLYEDSALDKAISYYRAALDMYKRVLGDVPHSSIARAMNNLAGALEQAEQYVEARELYEACLVMILEVYSYAHEELAVVYVNLGSLLHAQGQRNQGKQLLQQAIDMYTEIFGAEHSTVLETKNLINELEKNEAAVDAEGNSSVSNYCTVM